VLIREVVDPHDGNNSAPNREIFGAFDNVMSSLQICYGMRACRETPPERLMIYEVTGFLDMTLLLIIIL
jgi:hypothetical protein